MEKIKTKPIPENKVDWMEGISNEKTETGNGPMNEEQEDVINKLEEVFNFLKKLKTVQIKNKESLVNIKKPLDDLLSSLKYIPLEAPFDILPTEIKTDILSYLCDTGSFVAASVCQEWKGILKTKLNKLEDVTIGKHCDCESDECFMPEEILKASVIHGLDVPLSICHPMPNVDTEVIVEALSSVSSFRIRGECACVGESEDFEYGPVLYLNELKKLFNALEIQKKRERMISIDLRYLDLKGLDQNRLINYLLNKTMILTLAEGEYGLMLEVELLIAKLLQGSKLQVLKLHHLWYPASMSVAMADALCNVGFLDTGPEFHFRKVTVRRLIDNILTRSNMALHSLDIGENKDWRVLISPENLKIMLNKLTKVELKGKFSSDQVQIARSLPGVEADADGISKMKTGQSSRF